MVSLNLTNDVNDGYTTIFAVKLSIFLGSDWSPLVAQKLESSDKDHRPFQMLPPPPPPPW